MKPLHSLTAGLFTVTLALTMAGCGGQNATPQASAETEMQTSNEETAVPSAAEASNVLIDYFSVPEDLPTDGVDAIASASIVVRDGIVLGNTQYVAETIQQTIGGDIFCIETVEQYPLEHDALVDHAAADQDEEARPSLAASLENLDQYDVIMLGCPNWWGDLPMPLYTFLESYDFSGKTIIPFITHGGSRASDTVATIAHLQPEATVLDETLVIARGDAGASAEDVSVWVEKLDLPA